MRTISLAVACLAAVALPGCAMTQVAKKLTPEQAGDIAKDLVARCGGRFKVQAGADTGQLGGTARASLEVDATCPVPKNPPPAPAPVIPEPPT